MKNIYRILFFSLLFATNAQAQTWKAQTLPGSDSLSINDISIVNDTVAWAGTWNLDIADSSWNYNATGRVYRTINGGTTWTASTLPGTDGQDISNIVGLDANTAFASVYDFKLGNFVYKTANGGTTWTNAGVPLSPDSSFVDFVHFFSPARAMVMGDPRNGYFEIYQTGNAGTTWVRVPRSSMPDPEPGEFGFQNIYTTQGLNVWFGTSTGRLFRSTDGGYTWQAHTLGTPGSAGRFAFAKNMVGLTTGYGWNSTTKEFESNISRSIDSGKTWVDITPTNRKFVALTLAAIPTSNYFVMTGNVSNIKGKFTWLSRDSGKTWIVIDTVERILATEFIRATDPKKGLLGIIGYGGNLNSGTTNNSAVLAKIFSYNGTALTGLLTPSVLEANISLSPNPTADHINIQLTYKEASNFRLNINNVLGDLVYFEDFKDISTINKSLNIKQFPSGTYIVTIANPTGSLSRKFVKTE
jgi:photosystem II stability/assembly factor-like uncharacterized protein